MFDTQLIAAAFAAAKDGRVIQAEVDIAAILTAGGGIIIAIIAGYVQWFGSKNKGNIEAQAAIISGFVSLLDQNKKELDALRLRNALCERTLNRCKRALAENKITVFDDNGLAIEERKTET